MVGELQIIKDEDRAIAAREATQDLPAIPNDAEIGAVTLTKEERDVIDAPPEADLVSIRADGQVYLDHGWYRNRLTRAVGFGSYGTRVLKFWKEPGKNDSLTLYVWLALYVRGSYIGDAIGSHDYYPANRAQDYSDAFKAAKSNAFVRICSDHGLGTAPWSPQFRAAFIQEHCVKVICNQDGKMKSLWRRKDAPPLEGEQASQADSKDGGVKNSSAKTPEVVPPSSKATPQTAPPSSETVIDLDSGPVKATAEQVARLVELTKDLNQDAVKASLKQRRVASFEELTTKQADNIISKLEDK